MSIKKQKLLYILVIVMFVLSTTTSVFADVGPKNFDEAKRTKTIPTKRFAERLVDQNGVLSAEKKAELLQRLDKISEENNVDVVIALVKSTAGEDIVAYTDDYFDYNGFGLGQNKEDGIVLLISMAERKWAISTSGSCIKTFSDYGQSYIMDKKVLPWLRDGSYDMASTKFIDLAEKFIVKAKSGKPYTDKEIKNFGRTWATPLWYAIPIGFLIAAAIVLYEVYQLSDFKEEKTANAYLVGGAGRITYEKDIFLRREEKSFAKSSNDGGDSGGSSTHTSSSGRTHGGSSGSF